ncbi:MAG TPA: dephospho-CoA kinase [Candidatus Limnocylindria bacterium]|nr:dephospho-CoA kinase [Candidatus Limnocylindria bacterium]
MLRVGLTGGIASGKSSVASLLRDRDCQVLELDPLGHELLEPGQAAYDEVVHEFGNGILGPGDKVDRAKLGAIVFSDPAKRGRLNQILHPRILQVVLQWFSALDRPGGPDLAFAEAALLIEAGFQKELDKLIVCWARPDQQLTRLMERGMSREQASLRIAAQMPAEEKRALADEVIDCSGSFEETERQVDMVLAKLRKAAPGTRNKN